MKKLLLVSLSLILVALCIYNFHNTKQPKQAKAATHQTTQKSHTEEQTKLETYTYKITKIDSTGYYGTSTTDQTGIYFVSENIPKGTELNEGDIIEVTFPNDSFEEITHIEKIKAAPTKAKEPEYATFTYTITEIQNNDYYGKATDNTGIYFTSEYIKGNNINIGDTVKAYFDPKNTVDGLIYVEKN